MPAIIMIHGFRGTHHGLELIKAELKKLDFKHVIVPDLPGFGGSKPLEKHDLDDYVNWLNEFIKEQKLAKPPILLGHSFGSIIVAAYASRYPETIDKLVLVNPIGDSALRGPRQILTKGALLYYWLGKHLPAKVARLWLSSKLSVMFMSVTMAKTRDKSKRRFIHQQHLMYFSKFDNPRMLSEAFSTSINYSVRDFAAKIPVKTLLIAGDKDDITPLYKQKGLLEIFPQANLVTIDGVGHLTHYETPEIVAKSVYDFIKSV